MPSLFGHIVDRIRGVIENISSAFGDRVSIFGPSWEDRMEDDLDRARDIIMAHIEAEQPYGQFEEAVEFRDGKGNVTFERKGQYPSVRTGHTPISEGWRTLIERDSNTISLQFSNVSEHIWWVMGFKDKSRTLVKDKWSEPLNPPAPMVFWWGEPQSWPHRDGGFAGSRIYGTIDRKKSIPDDFIGRSMARAGPEISAVIQEGIGDYLIEVIERAGRTP